MSKKCNRDRLYTIDAVHEIDKKHFSIHDLKQIRPKTNHQNDVYHSFMNGQNVCMIGSAGSGKSFVALFLALNEVLDGRYDHVYIIRSVTPSKDIGFLPGTYEEKTNWCEVIYMAMCDQLFPWKNSYTNLKKAHKLKFETTTFLRGSTIDNAVIIMDEIQNFQENEWVLMMTRIGENSRVILCGDALQSDILNQNRKPNFSKHINIIRRMPEFDVVEFTRDDIVRSGLVKSYIIAKEDEECGQR